MVTFNHQSLHFSLTVSLALRAESLLKSLHRGQASYSKTSRLRVMCIGPWCCWCQWCGSGKLLQWTNELVICNGLQKYAVMRVFYCRSVSISHIFLQTRYRHMNRMKVDCSCAHWFLSERIQTSLSLTLENGSKMYVSVKCILTPWHVHNCAYHVECKSTQTGSYITHACLEINN